MAHLTEQGIANFKDFLQVYNQMTESCFNRCIINLNNRSLTDEEKSCSDVCAEKHMKFNNRLMGVYVVEQPIATERKMKEAEEQSNLAKNKMREQGIDVDNLSNDELVKEALKMNLNR